MAVAKAVLHYDWRLGLYTLLVAVFWALALGPGNGGTSELEVGIPGAILNALLLLPVYRGHSWPIPILGLWALGLTVGISLGGLPPSGPAFGGLAVISGFMFTVLCSFGVLPLRTGGSAE